MRWGSGLVEMKRAKLLDTLGVARGLVTKGSWRGKKPERDGAK